MTSALARDSRPLAALFAAWLVALVASLGALFVGEILGQSPCLLCWYQRAAMFPLAVILGIACLRDDSSVTRYATPLAAIGTAIALWHALYYFDVVPTAIEPCGQGPSCRSSDMTVFGVVPLPVLSLAAFVAIAALLQVVSRRRPRE
jgi:disulfide bond formation protein DsbB